MRASQKLSERCEWVRVVNKLDARIAGSDPFGPAGVRELLELGFERAAAVAELAKLGYVVPE